MPRDLEHTEAEEAAFERLVNLEREVRTTPAETVRSVHFKLRHLTGDSCWSSNWEPMFARPIEQAIADLERIAAKVSFKTAIITTNSDIVPLRVVPDAQLGVVD